MKDMITDEIIKAIAIKEFTYNPSSFTVQDDQATDMERDAFFNGAKWMQEQSMRWVSVEEPLAASAEKYIIKWTHRRAVLGNPEVQKIEYGSFMTVNSLLSSHQKDLCILIEPHKPSTV